jgi:hypothetical protein
MTDDEYFFGYDHHRAPRSVFYQGKPQPKRTHSFNKTHITQAKLELQRYRKQPPQRLHDDDDDGC